MSAELEKVISSGIDEAFNSGFNMDDGDIDPIILPIATAIRSWMKEKMPERHPLFSGEWHDGFNECLDGTKRSLGIE